MPVYVIVLFFTYSVVLLLSSPFKNCGQTEWKSKRRQEDGGGRKGKQGEALQQSRLHNPRVKSLTLPLTVKRVQKNLYVK